MVSREFCRKTGRIPAAHSVYPLLVEALTLWGGKQAARALNGLGRAAASAPDLRDEVRRLGELYVNSQRGVVRKAARELRKITQ